MIFLVFFLFFLAEYFFNWSFLEKHKNLYNFSLLGIIIQIIGIYLCTAIKQDRRYKDNFRNEGDKIFATVGSVIYFIGATIIHTSLLIIIILDI